MKFLLRQYDINVYVNSSVSDDEKNLKAYELFRASKELHKILNQNNKVLICCKDGF